jgi:hypothetical protein
MVDGLQGIDFSYALNARLVACPLEGMFELDECQVTRYARNLTYAYDGMVGIGK